MRTTKSQDWVEEAPSSSGYGVAAADPDFSSAAHGALLRQLHSLGEAPLAADAGAVLELLRLAAKLQPPSVSSGGQAAEPAPPLERLVGRCEAALIGGLDVSNCLDMLLHVKAAGGSYPRIVEAAEGLVREQLLGVVTQPRWAGFLVTFPREAAELMQATAVRLRRDVDSGGLQLRCWC